MSGSEAVKLDADLVAEIERMRQAGEVLLSERDEAVRRLGAVAALADEWAAAGMTPLYETPLEMSHRLRAVLPDAMRLPAPEEVDERAESHLRERLARSDYTEGAEGA